MKILTGQEKIYCELFSLAPSVPRKIIVML